MTIEISGKLFQSELYPQNRPLEEREYLVVVLINDEYITTNRFYKNKNFELINKDEIIISFCHLTMEEIDKLLA